MKQLKTTTKSGEYLLVEPDEVLSDYILIAQETNPLCISIAGYRCKLIGQLFGISEPLKSDILEGIRKEGWYTVNPAATQDEAIRSFDSNCRLYETHLWELGQDRTLDPDNTYCFKILK